MSTSPDVTSTDPQDLGEDGWVNRLIIGFLVLLAVLFVVSMVMVALQGFDAYRLKTSGEATTGVVTEASSRGFRRGLSSTYEFTLDGETYTGRGGKSDDRGDEIVVRYLPDDPSVHRPEVGLTQELVFGAGAALLLGLVLYGAHGIYEVWKRGEVTEVDTAIASTSAVSEPPETA